MKIWLRIASLIVFVAAASCASAADVSGTWKGAFDFQGSSVALTFHLSDASGVVTGTVEGLPTTPVEIHEGKTDGSTVTFWVNSDYEGQTYKLIYKGALSATGDQIAFTLGTEDGSWNTQITAARDVAPAAPDVNGVWKGAFDFQGSSVPLTFHLSAAGGAVTGTVEGLETSPAEIHEGKVDGDAVTFWINTDYEGQTYKLVYKGKITAGQISFSFGTEDGSWSAEVTAAKGV